MSIREPLKAGTIITMPNNGRYVICEKIGEGGLSLIYSAKTKSNGYPVIIKEFFPSEHTRRALRTKKATDGTLIERKNRVYPEDKRHSERFMQCYKAFEREGQLGSEARSNNFQVISFSDCGDGYAVLPRWSSDTCSFDELVSGWGSVAPDRIDPVYTDLGRVRFSLTAISSLLCALSSLHAHDILHLDISPSNVVWAGASRTFPENGTALLTDFGCSVLMEDGAYPVEYVLSYSKAFAAPEYRQKQSHLTCASDIFSVGKLLMFLCCGSRAFDLHTNLCDEVKRLKISKRHQEQLAGIMSKATAYEMASRYQSAAEMAAAVNALLESLPLHPINPDSTGAFTLYSMKSMLEGSLDTHYSWAHELCDRRNVVRDYPEWICAPISSAFSGQHAAAKEFFDRIMPRYISKFFDTKLADNPNVSMADIFSCNYPKAWKNELSQIILQYGSDQLADKCRALLSDTNTFLQSKDFLFAILGNDSDLKRFYNRCDLSGDIHIGLAMITLYALLGEASFKMLFENDATQCAAFFRK